MLVFIIITLIVIILPIYLQGKANGRYNRANPTQPQYKFFI
jgi:hypothetical protein